MFELDVLRLSAACCICLCCVFYLPFVLYMSSVMCCKSGIFNFLVLLLIVLLFVCSTSMCFISRLFLCVVFLFVLRVSALLVLLIPPLVCCIYHLCLCCVAMYAACLQVCLCVLPASVACFTCPCVARVIFLCCLSHSLLVLSLPGCSVYLCCTSYLFVCVLPANVARLTRPCVAGVAGDAEDPRSDVEARCEARR